MAKDRVERELEQLQALAQSEARAEASKDLRKALHDRVNVIVAKAATIAERWQATALMPDLSQAFTRLLDAPETDPQCWGKNAISAALRNLGWSESDLFLRGSRHFQYENTWGGKVDTAAPVRATCVLALVQCTDLPRDEILRHLVAAMTEADAHVRADAARAMEQMGGRDAMLLLRLKARCGDAEVRVTGQVLEAVLQLEGATGVGFVEGFLRLDEEVAEEAALALGSSRLAEGFEVLKRAVEAPRPKPKREVLLRAMSASRLDAALGYLVGQIRTARLREAEEALRAMELHRGSEEIVRRIAEAVEERGELRAAYVEKFTESHR